jgi:hypothetical protein
MSRRFAGHSTIGAAALVAALGLVFPCAPTGQAPTRNLDSATGQSQRTRDGHPDLSGVWTGGGGGGVLNAEDNGDNITVTLNARDGTPINFERDNTLLRRRDPNKPLYKPQFWEKVQQLDQNGNTEDPGYGCLPLGVPRMGPPSKIVQTPTEMIFLYQVRNTFRVIPTDGRQHTSVEDLEGTWTGESLGRWEGDTFVIDSIGFTDASWLDIAGYFHGENMHVIERLRRQGDTLTWQATVDDPEILLTPWVMNARTVRLNPDSKAVLAEDLPCQERDLAHLVTKEHH